MRFKAVVEIGGVVGDFVGQIDELRFERRPLVKTDIRRVPDAVSRCNRANA